MTAPALDADAFAAAVVAGLMRPPGPRPPPDAATLIARAEAAVARIDRWGTRGVTGLSADQIEAMALVIAAAGAIAALRARLAAGPPEPARAAVFRSRRKTESETTKGDTR